MANYESAIILGYVGFTALIFWLGTKFDNDNMLGTSLKFFLTSIGFFMIWMGIGNIKVVAESNGAPASIVETISTTYVVLLWTFITILFFMFLQFLANVINLMKGINMNSKGKVRE